MNMKFTPFNLTGSLYSLEKRKNEFEIVFYF